VQYEGGNKAADVARMHLAPQTFEGRVDREGETPQKRSNEVTITVSTSRAKLHQD
jgi:hypothetical protein